MAHDEGPSFSDAGWAATWIDRLEAARGRSRWHAQELEPGVSQMPFCEWPGPLFEFVNHLYARGLVRDGYRKRLRGQDELLRTGEGIGGLTEEQCWDLLAFHVRTDRFVEGHLAGKLDRGDITAVLRRLAEMAEGGW